MYTEYGSDVFIVGLAMKSNIQKKTPQWKFVERNDISNESWFFFVGIPRVQSLLRQFGS